MSRIVLPDDAAEASDLLAVSSESGGRSFITCHDEVEPAHMVSLIIERGDRWELERITLELPPSRANDAEALARHGDWIFVIGSGFAASSLVDRDRAFIVRFEAGSLDSRALDKPATDSPALGRPALGRAAVPADQMALGDGLVHAVNAALEDQGVELLGARRRVAQAMERAGLDPSLQPLNIEGAAFSGDDLVLGLRWPVHSSGNPLLAVWLDAASVLSEPRFAPALPGDLSLEIVILDCAQTTHRPAGIRALSWHEDRLHAVIGSTERKLVDGKTKPAAFSHVSVVWPPTENASAHSHRRFEGLRKVEGLAPSAGGWVYVQDDEDAVVILAGDDSA